MRVDEYTIELGSSPAFYRSADASGAAVLYLHGVPTSSDDWLEPLELTGGIAPDLIGFGRSSKAGNLDYSIGGLAGFVQQLLAVLGLEPAALVGHDWGAAVALELARRDPARVTRLALISPPALIEGFRWPAHARWWRAPVAGELLMGSTGRAVLARWLRRASATPGAWPEHRIDSMWEQFDQGTQRAILRLHRETDPSWVSARARELHPVDAPALIVRGERDPWVSDDLAGAYAGALANGRVLTVAGAGHWPWRDQPRALEQLQEFLR